jgi:superfamily I DNA and RNA helicase
VGPSGSGKTLILAHKAAFLKQYNPKINNILFVCYNITLVNYIRRLLSAKKVPLGESGVSVHHFYELCCKIIGEEVAYEKEGSEFYEMVVQEALSKVQNYKKKFDATLIDEGRTFPLGAGFLS